VPRPLPRILFYPREHRDLVIERFEEMHHERLRYLAPALIVAGVYFIAYDALRLPRDPGAPFAGLLRWFLALDSFFIAAQVAVLALLFTLFRPRPGTRGRVPRGFAYGYALVMLLWAGLVTGFELRIAGNVTSLVIAIMAAPVLLSVSFVPFCLLISASIGAFLLSGLLVPGLQPVAQSRLWFLLALGLVSVVVSRTLFTAFTQNILVNRELAEANATLRATQESLILKEKFAAIGQLSAGIAHEINNPLGFLKSNLSALEQGCRRLAGADAPAGGPSAFLQENLHAIFADSREGFRRISEVIDNLRSFSYAPAPGSFAPYDVNQGVESTLVIARGSYKKVAEVRTELGPVPRIDARGSEINQVLLNLVLNAAHAVASVGAAEPGFITVSTRADGTHVHCEVSDSGPGVPEEIRTLIFNPFFTTKPVGDGLGLGLSLSYEIVVNRHHGSLLLMEGAPTRFRLSLPIRQPTEE
jgi:signal transduction histidine kinase